MLFFYLNYKLRQSRKTFKKFIRPQRNSLRVSRFLLLLLIIRGFLDHAPKTKTNSIIADLFPISQSDVAEDQTNLIENQLIELVNK